MTLEERVADLEHRIDALLNETEEDRAKREQRAWEVKRQRDARTSQIRQHESRIADLDQRLADVEPWAACLTKIRKEVEAELAELREQMGGRGDASDRRRSEDAEVLEDTLLAIDGACDWRERGNLHTRVTALNLPLTYGRRHPLQDRLMLPRTKQLIAEFRKERKAVQAELDALQKGEGSEGHSGWASVCGHLQSPLRPSLGHSAHAE